MQNDLELKQAERKFFAKTQSSEVTGKNRVFDFVL